MRRRYISSLQRRTSYKTSKWSSNLELVNSNPREFKQDHFPLEPYFIRFNTIISLESSLTRTIFLSRWEVRVKRGSTALLIPLSLKRKLRLKCSLKRCRKDREPFNHRHRDITVFMLYCSRDLNFVSLTEVEISKFTKTVSVF